MPVSNHKIDKLTRIIADTYPDVKPHKKGSVLEGCHELSIVVDTIDAMFFRHVLSVTQNFKLAATRSQQIELTFI